MKSLLVLVTCVALSGCFETIKPIEFVPPKIQVDSRLYAPCSKELPVLASGFEADVVENYSRITKAYAQCADNNNSLIEVLQRVLGDYGKAVDDYVTKLKSLAEERK